MAQDLTANSKSYPRERDEVTTYTAVRTQARFHAVTNPIYARVISKPIPSAAELLRLDDTLLQPWLESLPSYFRDDTIVPQRFTFAHAVMRWRYRNFRIIMYRPFVIRQALNSRDAKASLSADDDEACRRCLGDAEGTITAIAEYWRGHGHEHNRLEAWYAL